MNRAARLCRALLFPPKCVSCRERLPYDATLPLCKNCSDEWEKETVEPCGFCQKPVSECLCTTPHLKNSGISTLFKLAYYKAGQKTCPNKLLFRMKESASEQLYSFVAKQLSKNVLAYLQNKKISVSDCILTHAPRHRRALLRSGLDQAERLAKELSKELGIEWRKLLVRKRGKNKAQKKLGAAERIKNAKEAFAIKKGSDLAGKLVLLVDDTVTTGATMGACAKLLKGAGAGRVIGISLTLDEVGRYPKEEPFSTKPCF